MPVILTMVEQAGIEPFRFLHCHCEPVRRLVWQSQRRFTVTLLSHMERTPRKGELHFPL